MSHWRLSDWTLGVLVTLAVLAAWEGYELNNRPETCGCGGDFPQFYVAGEIISRGEAERLYDQPYFRQYQASLRNDPLRSLYPPTMGLLMAPLARLPYDQALAAWWALQAVCLFACGVIFYRTAPIARPWRINMLVALAGLVPLWVAVGIGHLAPMLLLVLAGGLTLHRQGKCRWAGLVLSILALKPQLAAGLVLWMLLRRDLRTLLGLAAGFALQALTVALVLGPRLWLDYAYAMPGISAVTRAYRYSPLFEQSLTGIVSNLFCGAGLEAWQVPAMKITYAVTVSAAAVMLCRVVWAGSREQGAGGTERGAWSRGQGAGNNTAGLPAPCSLLHANHEYACGSAVYDDSTALFPRLRPDAPGPAASHALVVAGLEMGRGLVRYGLRIDGRSFLYNRFQPHRIYRPGDHGGNLLSIPVGRQVPGDADPNCDLGLMQGGVFMSRWRLSDWTLGLLVVLAMLAVWEGYMIGNCPANHGCGGCFSQFYVAGMIVRHGEVERLYDQPYFRHLQESMREDPLRSLYPPTMGLLLAPLARLSYNQAMTVWWALQALCLLATGVIFYRRPWVHGARPLTRPWRINMLVALAGLLPLWIGVFLAQLAPMLLLVVAGGLTLHKRGQHVLAGLALSLLALKPQLAAGLVLWMLLRRDFRTLFGLAAGFAFQFLAVAAILGPRVWLDYLHAMPTISAVTRYYHYSPLVEASFAGIASNLFWSAGLAAWEVAAMKITYAVTVSAAVVLLCRVVWAGSREQGARPRGSLLPAPCSTLPANYEYACGVLFMMIFPPYFILYDQTLLAIPLVMLWSSPAWRWGVALFATATAVSVNLSLVLGFNFGGFVALAAMVSLAGQFRSDAEVRRVACLNGSAV